MHLSGQDTTRVTVEAVFRRSAPALVSSLTRALGSSALDLVEAVVQEAFLRALEQWPRGVPANPEGWLRTVARNLALDQIRRDRSFQAKEAAIGAWLDASAPEAPPLQYAAEIPPQLAMIYLACHPCNRPPSQVALSLRTLCGLEVPAIARALHAREDAVEKRLVLARRRIREENPPFDLPAPDELAKRTEVVLRVLYLLFNEGYSSTTGPDLVQPELAIEAMRLAALLADQPQTDQPAVRALLALMHLHASRFPARVDAAGELVTLARQDRARWDGALIAAGLRHLEASATGDAATAYHFEAAIAAVHATSASTEQTDWARIVSFYDQLLYLHPSPGARLSRAIALGWRDGPLAGLEALDALGQDPIIARLAAFHAARAELLLDRGELADARAALALAGAAAVHPQEQRHLARRLGQVLER